MARSFYCGLLNKIGFAVLPLLAFVFVGRPGLSAESAGDPSVSFDVPHPPAAPPVLPMSMGGVSSDGHRLAVNSRYLTLDGKPWLPVIGEFHFSRYPEAEWEEHLLKMKAAGVQIVAKPLFPFNYGLSYTRLAYSDLKIAAFQANRGELAAVSFKIKNTGTREGAEIAPVCVGDSHAPLPRPAKGLKGFARASLRPGETKTVTMLLDHRAFSYFDPAQHNWVAAPGEFAILVGSSCEQISLRGKYSLAPGQENR